MAVWPFGLFGLNDFIASNPVWRLKAYRQLYARLLGQLDAAGNLRFALGTDYEEAKAAAMLTALGLTCEEDRPVREWSGGMKRRLALARALLAASDAVALDEPFTGLDEENRRRAALCIAAAAETKPVILVTHDRTELDLLRAKIVNL